jgi:serine protease inhibitor
LLQQESVARIKQNVFISPLSIFLALAMTENGQRERPRSQCGKCWLFLPMLTMRRSTSPPQRF